MSREDVRLAHEAADQRVALAVRAAAGSKHLAEIDRVIEACRVQRALYRARFGTNPITFAPAVVIDCVRFTQLPPGVVSLELPRGVVSRGFDPVRDHSGEVIGWRRAVP